MVRRTWVGERDRVRGKRGGAYGLVGGAARLPSPE